MRRIVLSAVGLLSAVACGVAVSPKGSDVYVRDLTVAEALSDFDTLVATFRDQYGPLEFKERRFGFSFDQLAQSLRAELENAGSDKQVFNIYSRFVSSFRDGHVSIRFNGKASAGENRARIPLFVEPIEGNAVITSISDESLASLGISVGDIVLSVDGRSPQDWLDLFKQTDALGNPVSDEHLYLRLFSRKIEQADSYPSAATARVIVKKPDGTLVENDLTWRRTNDLGLAVRRSAAARHPGQLQMVVPFAGELNKEAGLDKMGSFEPFFRTDEVLEKFGFVEVGPNSTFLKKYGAQTEDAPKVYSALYEHNGKRILLVRQPTYSPDSYEEVADLLKVYRATLDQFDSVADVLVIDQTNNPGGYLDYCVGFSQLFMQTPGAHFVQAMNADRKWIDEMRAYAFEMDPDFKSEASLKYLGLADAIEAEYDAGKSITAPLPFYGERRLLPDASYTWKKPVLVLINELAGSCGDIFPMMVKRNQTGVLFGQRTMGLGGNVEQFELSASRASVSMTRGLFTTYKEPEIFVDADFAENNGVLPDIPHTPTLEDFRNGYTGYVERFSEEAVRLVSPQDAQPEPPNP
jgi:C-terminal processing protease CtpA/Prc